MVEVEELEAGDEMSMLALEAHRDRNVPECHAQRKRTRSDHLSLVLIVAGKPYGDTWKDLKPVADSLTIVPDVQHCNS